MTPAPPTAKEPYGQELFSYMAANHNLTLLESELHEIERIVVRQLRLSCRKCGERLTGYIDNGMCGLCADDERNGR